MNGQGGTFLLWEEELVLGHWIISQPVWKESSQNLRVEWAGASICMDGVGCDRIWLLFASLFNLV